jgi:histidinol-phosphate aminotransferase
MTNDAALIAPTDVCELVPQHIRAIAPYQPGKPISQLAREMGIAERDIVKLASNENPRGLSPKARRAIDAAIPELARYPDGFDLTQALAARYGIPASRIILGNGSNDVLEMAAGAFLTPGTSAVYSQHAFAVYPLATQARGARSIVVPAKRYAHDLEAMRRAIDTDTRIVFIANPNNPTGTFIAGNDLEAFVRDVPKRVLIVVDEAYNEYLPGNVRYDSVAWLDRYANLALTRTFSKAYGLAGLRVGYALCHDKVADLLNRVRQPFNVNNLALAAATAALDDTDFVHESHALNLAGMRQLTEAFQHLGLAWIPSYGNFVSVEVPRAGGRNATVVYQELLRRGVIVRPVGGYGMPDHLRVTIGVPQENDRFIAALTVALEKSAA